MQHPKYNNVSKSDDKMEFGFESVGPRGVYRIVVQFSLLYGDNVFNLAFGATDIDGSFNDTIILDNDDRNKILATIVNIVTIFIDFYPRYSVYFTGSTLARTRLYRRVINFAIRIKKRF